MPTGYTADVQSGKVTEFPAFAMTCARAFGALVMMRDDPLDAPIVDLKPSTHHREWADAQREQITKLEAMTTDEVAAACDVEYREELKRYEERQAERDVQRGRYEAMLVKVRAWDPPTGEHTNLKEFMLQQLGESIKFDCGYVTKGPEKIEPTEWLKKSLESHRSMRDRYEQGQREEDERTASRNEWVRQLRASLESPPVAAI